MMEKEQTLELLVCTINEGIRKVPELVLPPKEGVRYLVSWQQTGTVDVALPAELQGRTDIKVVTLEGRGLAANRNNALRNASGDILLLADDDCRYRAEYFDRVKHDFAKYPRADCICFRAVDRKGNFLKRYAAQPFTYAKRPRGTYFSSVEIAFRRKPDMPLFDERFGLGSPFLASGEDEVFLFDAWKSGLKVIYLPETIVETEGATTGKRFMTFGAVRRSKGAVLCHLYGAAGATMRSLKYILYLDVDIDTKRRFFHDMLLGIRYIRSGRLQA